MGLYSGRDADELLARALETIDRSEKEGCYRTPASSRRVFPLFSGGHDSYCACWIASKHRLFDGNVYHIDTGIGCRKTRTFVEQVCVEEGWKLNVVKSSSTYEWLVSSMGFPGPPLHRIAYNRLKDRCVRSLTKRNSYGHYRSLLITGCRSQESVRRMGHVEPVKVGEWSKAQQRAVLTHRVWTAPCHDWSSDEQRHFMDVNGMPRNPIKMSPLGMSGECFCGCFARPEEFELIEEYAPDVATEIRRLTVVAKECGKPCGWGYEARQRKEGKVVLDEALPTGPLCNSCDSKAKASGVIISDLTCSPRVKRSSP